jgi:putative ABC transport system permease protein
MSRLRVFRLLNLRPFRRQPLRVVLAVVAMGAGVALTVSTGLMLTSLDRSIRDVLRSLAGPAPLRVVGPIDRAGVDVSVTGKVEAVDGVDAAVPAVHAVAVAESSDGSPVYFLAVGVDCRVEALLGPFGCDARTLAPQRRDAPVVISASLARELGRGAVIRTDAGRMRLGRVAVNDSLDETNRGRVAVYDLATAQRLFGRSDRIDAVYVKPSAGTDLTRLRARIQSVVGSWNAVLPKDELPPWMQLNGPILPLLGLAGLLGLGLSGVLVYNIVALSLAERRRDHAVAGAVGASTRAITVGVLAEAALLGLAGGAIGAVSSIGFVRPLVASASKVLFEQSSGIKPSVHVSWGLMIMGVLLGVLTGVIAAWVPARRARRIDLAAELHGRAALIEEAPRRARVRVALLVFAGGLGILGSYFAQRNGALEPWQSSLATPSLVVAGLFLLAAVGAAAPLVLKAVLRPLRATGGPLRVAVSNLVGRPRRTSVMASTVGAAVALACLLGSIIPAIRSTTRSEQISEAGGRVFISTLPMNNAGASARPSEKLLAAVAALPGVARIDANRCLGVSSNVQHVTGLGLCAQAWRGDTPPFERVAGEVSARAIARGEAIIGTSAARSLGLRPGSTMHIPTPTGVASVRVAGIWSTAEDNGYRVSISPRRFDELFGDERAENLYVVPEPGVSATTLARTIEDAHLDPDLYVRTPQQASAQLADEVDDQVAPFWMLQRLLLFVALVASLSTLLLVGVQRRRELGVLGAVGFGPGGLARMTIAEAIAAGLTGSVLGTIASLGLFEVLRNASRVAVGVRPPYGFDPVSALVSTVLALIVVTVGALLPAWRTSRVPIVEAIRDE